MYKGRTPQSSQEVRGAALVFSARLSRFGCSRGVQPPAGIAAQASLAALPATSTPRAASSAGRASVTAPRSRISCRVGHRTVCQRPRVLARRRTNEARPRRRSRTRCPPRCGGGGGAAWLSPTLRWQLPGRPRRGARRAQQQRPRGRKPTGLPPPPVERPRRTAPARAGASCGQHRAVYAPLSAPDPPWKQGRG